MKRTIKIFISIMLLLLTRFIGVQAQKSETLSNYGCSFTYSISGARLVKSDEEHPFEHYYDCEVSPGATISVKAKCNDKKFVNAYNVEEENCLLVYFKVTGGGKVLKEVHYTREHNKKNVSFTYHVPSSADAIELSIHRPIGAPRHAFVNVNYKVVKRTSNTSTKTTRPSDPDKRGLIFQSPYKDKLYYKILRDNNSVEVTSRVKRIAEGEVEIPPYVTHNNKKYKVVRIGVGAFARLQRLTKVIVPETVTEIADSAFIRCPNLKKVYVQGGLKAFGSYVTAYCPKLEVFSIKKGSQIVSTSNYVYDKSKSRVLTGWGNSKVTIGGKVTIIEGAFAGSSVSQVVLKTCDIQKYAFLHCSNLRYVDISEKYNINDLAFVYCTNFKEVRVKVKPDKKISLKNTPGKIVHYKN